MKNRDKVLYMLLGAFLVVLGMVLNHSIDNADANTQADLSLVREVIKMVEEAYPGSVDIGEVSILDTVVCKRVLCVNNEGMLLGSMGFTHEDGGFLTLLDQREKKLLTLLPGDKDVISYKNKKTDSYDKNLFSLGLDGNDNGVLSLHNKVGTNTSTLGHDKTGDGGLWLHDKAGTNTSILGHDENGNNSLICENLVIQDKNARQRAFLGKDSNGDPMLKMYGDDDKHEVAYLGVNTRSNEMMFELNSKSKTDKGKVRIMMSQWGGIMACFNNMEKPVANLGIGDDGSGFMFTTDKYGYRE